MKVEKMRYNVNSHYSVILYNSEFTRPKFPRSNMVVIFKIKKGTNRSLCLFINYSKVNYLPAI